MRLRATALGICLVAALAAPGAQALGQPAAPPSPRSEAMDLFKQSRAAYREGRFREAAGLLRRAYALDPAPTLLYNLARALESDGDFEGAVRAYQDYLAADPNAEDKAAIQRRIENLQTQIAERQELERRLEEARARPTGPAAAPPAGPAGDPSPPGLVTPAPEARSAPVVPWVVAGLGVAGVATGAALGAMAQGKHRQAEDAPVQADAVRLDEDARGLARGANIALIAGGALAAGGLVWGLIATLSGEPAPAAEPTVALFVGPGSAGLHGRF